MTIDDSTGHQPDDPISHTNSATPGWVVPLLVVAGLLIAGGIWWATGSNGTGSSSVTGQERPIPTEPNGTEPDVTALGASPAITMATALTPTAARDATNDEGSANREAEPQQAAALARDDNSPIALPTVTPTPREIPTRTVTIGGVATLRMGLENPNFESAGRPLEIPIEPATYFLRSDTPVAVGSSCTQLGLVHLQIDLEFTLLPEDASVASDGAVNLRQDFCDDPGPITDSEPAELVIPADAIARVNYTLQGSRALLSLPGLLDTNTWVYVELELSNTKSAVQP